MMDKILPNDQIFNKVLRERTDISPLEKTASQHYHYAVSEKDFCQWITLLAPDEQIIVQEYLCFSNERWQQILDKSIKYR